MFLVGLTGGIASGKSTVTSILREAGCAVIDADVISRQVVQVGSKGWRQVRDQFGEDILCPDGSIDRTKLGEIIFSDSTKRRQLNAITHPLIRWEMLWQTMRNLFAGYRYTIIDAPLLIETRGPISALLGDIIIVYCTPEQQLERLQVRNSLTIEQARNRITSQMPLEEKKSMATNNLCLIDNSGSYDDTRSQVLKLKEYLDSKRTTEVIRAAVAIIVGSLFILLIF
ncbi:dephospho-CoA kinase domain-containing protein-like [Watersipora subatra]|uniref:dephospho-CoA kinase domain-containing protein-like n=1 Tax=Watersipora subatra TaxID=2589382 RepID=UPI00355B0642